MYWVKLRVLSIIDKAILRIAYNLNSIEFLKLISRYESALFINQNIQDSLVFSSRPRIQEFAAIKSASIDGDILEFGVLGGKSLNFFVDYCKTHKLDRKVIGFDSFEGLGESWTNVDAYDEFNLSGRVPASISVEARLVVGDIQDSLPSFLLTYDRSIALVHIDTDSYLPAKIILSHLCQRLSPGSLILFDDFHGFPGWQFGERLALQEVLGEASYQFLAFGPHQALIQIK